MSRRFDCTDPEQRKTGLREAASAVRRGELVVLPTDTLYGIGADAFTDWAVRALLEAKGRGPDMPIPVLVRLSGDDPTAWSPVPTQARRQLIEAFWPGGLSLRAQTTPPSLNLGPRARPPRWMLRMPLHPVAIER